ncbi:class I SAM-dependent methyltransferase [Noviherbaspirillum denitrificans]|uniref:Methyltransferase type 11 domain-containing protein n=1 Tax=Noviherbaspirillum denitrificans TaxID=1968433 RepID=A0A254TP09_9BURK|nr:class I SAM-dependent methyltransferase [Noviherbaspirillum denitrificans]OWW22353.1 hypothetical protein AYR66_25515 [Noviherbaspirillum denitrificans]
MQDEQWLDKWTRTIARNVAILELGCGGGRDTRRLAEQGFSDITATDLSRDALDRCGHAVPAAHLVCHDLNAPLPFADARFDVVIASLCLHYFAWDKTVDAVREIRRCLAPGGLLLCRVNSTRDVHFGAIGHPELAHHYYDVDGRPKRFFDAEDLERLFTEGWERLSMREATIDRYDKPKTAWEIALRPT